METLNPWFIFLGGIGAGILGTLLFEVALFLWLSRDTRPSQKAFEKWREAHARAINARTSATDVTT